MDRLTLVCTSATGYFHDMIKQKSVTNTVELPILLFTAKILHETMYLTFRYPGQITHKFNLKIVD